MASALLLLCLLAAAHPFTAARPAGSLALQIGHSPDAEPSAQSSQGRKDTAAVAVLPSEPQTEPQEDGFDLEVPEDDTALALLALSETRPLIPPDTLHWRRWQGIRRRALGGIPTGSAALASALAAMARAKKYTSFIALVQRSGELVHTRNTLLPLHRLSPLPLPSPRFLLLSLSLSGCVCLSISLSPPLSLPLSLSLSRPPSLFLSPFPSLALPLSLWLPVSCVAMQLNAASVSKHPHVTGLPVPGWMLH